MNRLTISPLAVSGWPAHLAERWVKNVARQRWSSTYATRVAKALGLWLRFAGDVSPTAEGLGHFQARLTRDLAHRSAASYCQLAAYGAPLLWPDADWSWIRECIAGLQPPPRSAQNGIRPRRERLALPVEEWPEVWRARWNAALKPMSRRAKRAACTQWSVAYQARVQRGVGRYLGWLDGREPIIDDDQISAYTTYLDAAGLSPVSIGMHLEELAAWCRTIVRQADSAALLQALADDYTAEGPGRRKMGRIVPLAEVERLARCLVREAQTMPMTTSAATRCRDGVMIAILARRPIRLRNFAGLRIGKDIVIQGNEAMLVLETTKNGDPYVAPLPNRVVSLLQIYLDVYRPILAGAPTVNDLWIGRDGGAMGPKSISARVGKVTEREFGRKLTPHLFRDVLATEAYKAGADATVLCSTTLGHRDTDTQARHYQHGKSTAAASALRAVVAARRKCAAVGRRGRTQ